MLRTRLRAALIVALLAAGLATAATAWAVADLYANNVPGSVPPASPFSEYLDDTTDTDDVFALNVTAGQNVFVKMTGASGTDFDLHLFPPGAPSVNGTTPALAYSETIGTSSEQILVRNAPYSGIYYIDAWAYAGTGAYTLTYGFPSIQPVLDASAPSAVGYGGSTAIRGRLIRTTGEPVVGEVVGIYAKAYRQTSYVRIGQGVTDATGAYAVTIKPTSATRYRARFLGSPTYLPADASEVVVTPRAYLTRPSAPSSVKVGARFASIGYLKPRHTAGTSAARITCYRLENGVWRARKTVYATSSNFMAYTKYTARYSLPYAGKWKLVAMVPGDGLHLTTYSSARYLTVVR